MLLQGIGDEQQSVLETERPGIRHALHQEVAGILERGELLGKRPRGGAIAGRGRAA